MPELWSELDETGPGGGEGGSGSWPAAWPLSRLALPGEGTAGAVKSVRRDVREEDGGLSGLVKGLELPKGLAVEAELGRAGIPVALAEGCAPLACWVPVVPRNIPGWLFMAEFIPQELAAGEALGLVGNGRFMPALERPEDCPRHESLD